MYISIISNIWASSQCQEAVNELLAKVSGCINCGVRGDLIQLLKFFHVCVMYQHDAFMELYVFCVCMSFEFFIFETPAHRENLAHLPNFPAKFATIP